MEGGNIFSFVEFCMPMGSLSKMLTWQLDMWIQNLARHRSQLKAGFHKSGNLQALKPIEYIRLHRGSVWSGLSEEGLAKEDD